MCTSLTVVRAFVALTQVHVYLPPICRSTTACADPNLFCAVHTYSPVSSVRSEGMVSTPPSTRWLYGRRPPRRDHEICGGGEPVASHVSVTKLPTDAVRLCRSTRITGLAEKRSGGKERVKQVQPSLNFLP